MEGSLKYNDGTDHGINGNSFTMPSHSVTLTCAFKNPGLEELDAIANFLQSSENVSKGLTKNAPISISVTSQVPLEQLYDILETSDKYVNLDLSDSGITAWNYIRGHKTGKEKIVSLILPDTITDLPDNIYVNYEEGFASFDNLTSIAGASIQTIGSAFKNCRELTGIDLPAVTTVGGAAFSGCNKLTEIIFSTALSIGDSAFSGCTRLERMNLPVATTISGNAFSGCFNLTEISIPAVTSIGESAFSGCGILASISIPAGTLIGDGAFTGCSSLIFSVTGAGNLSTSENGKILLKNSTTLVAYPSAIGIINIPASITTIGNHAFSTSNIVTIAASGVTTVGDSAFSACRQLTGINLGSASQIGNDVFVGCVYLTEVGLPSTRVIGSGAFSNCERLTTVNLPLVTIIENGIFFGCNQVTTITIPSVSVIKLYAFFGCFNLPHLDLPSVVSIGDRAFEFCYGLTTLRMGPTPPETVGEDIFHSIQGAITLQVPVGKREIYETWERANRQTMWWTVNVVEVG